MENSYVACIPFRSVFKLRVEREISVGRNSIQPNDVKFPAGLGNTSHLELTLIVDL